MSFDPCPTCPDFWNFGFDDSGVKDYKAEVDHILEATSQEKVHFIGHSMGTTQFIVRYCSNENYNCFDVQCFRYFWQNCLNIMKK